MIEKTNSKLTYDVSIIFDDLETKSNAVQLSVYPDSSTAGNNGDFYVEDTSLYFKAGDAWLAWQVTRVGF